MKDFENLTKEDAIKILQAAYPFSEEEFKFKDDSFIISVNDINFIFEDQDITISRTINGTITNDDVHTACYIKAHELGYQIDLLDNFLKSSKIENTNNEKYFLVYYYFQKDHVSGYGNHGFKDECFKLKYFSNTLKEILNLKNIAILGFNEITEKEYLEISK